MTTARSATMNEKVEGIFHCMSQCVRQCFLCGTDPNSENNYDYRKDWFLDRLEMLSAIFLIEVCGYAIMSNHYHLILRNRPDLVAALSDEEVIALWRKLAPHKPVNLKCQEAKEAREELLKLQDLENVEVYRSRLSSISWFMRYLNEYIARRANAEDGCKGRFWSGRFKSVALLDDEAVLACTAYVDLNPIRAGLAETPETSDYTSAKERIAGRQMQKKRETLEKQKRPIPLELIRREERASWLCPVENTGKRRGFLPIDLDKYLKILDLTGRKVVEGKSGAIPKNLEPILTRLDIDHQRWINISTAFEAMHYRVAGSADHMAKAAKKAGQRWFKRRQFKAGLAA